MMNKSECMKIINETEISDDYFLRLHFCAEAVVRRLFLIGLRLQGVQYTIAEQIAEEYNASGLQNHIKKVFSLCGIDYNKLKSFGKYAALESLFFKFSTRHRNLRVQSIKLI